MTPDPDEAQTGLPMLRSWRAVYILVLGALLLWIGLLTALARFSP